MKCFSLLAALFLSAFALTAEAGSSLPPFTSPANLPAVGNDVSGTPSYKPALSLGADGSVLTPGLRFETMNGNQSAPTPGFGYFEFLRSGTDFTSSEGTFIDPNLTFGFNQCAGGNSCNPIGAVFGWSLETDFATETGSTRSTITHAMEQNFNMKTAPRVKIVFSGTPKTGDTITVTLVGQNIPGGARSYSVAAATGNTLAQQATAWTVAFNNDSTTIGQMYAFTDGGANAWIATETVGQNFLAPSTYPSTVTASGSVTGSGATDVITVTQNDVQSFRTVELGCDRDRGPNGLGYCSWEFFIGNGTNNSDFTVVDGSNNALFQVAGAGYFYLGAGINAGSPVNIISRSALIMGAASGQDVALQPGGGAYTYDFRPDGQILFGDGKSRVASPADGIVRVSSDGPGPIMQSVLGGSPTGLTGAGSGGAFEANSTDGLGRIDLGSSPANTISFTFLNTGYANAPICWAQNQTHGQIITPNPTTSGLTLSGSFVASDKIAYGCQIPGV